jgi:hypothetical protein
MLAGVGRLGKSWRRRGFARWRGLIWRRGLKPHGNGITLSRRI